MQKIKAISYFPMSNLTTINDMLERSIAKHAERTAIVHRVLPGDEPVRVSYKQLGQDIETIIQGLATLEPGSERRIAVTGENSFFWMLSYYAAVTALGTVVPLDRLLQPVEMFQLLQRSEVDTLVCDAAIYTKLATEEDLSTLPFLKHVVVMLPERLTKTDRSTYDELKARASAVTVHEFSEVYHLGQTVEAAGQQKTFPLPDPEAPLILIFTSGTTANAKGVMLTHRSICSNLRGLEGMVRFPDRVRMLSVLPLNHAFENTCGMLFTAHIGAEVYICDGLRYVQQNMQEYKTQMLIGVPNIFDAFYKKIKLTAKKAGSEKKLAIGIKLSRILRKLGIDRRRKIFSEVHAAFGGEFAFAIVGAAPMNPEVGQFFEDIGIRIMQGYGLTETSPVVSGCNTQLLVNGSVGVPLPGVEVAIDNEAPGEIGEILVRGDLLMSGYYRDPEATAEVLDQDGWFHTGDLGQIDAKTETLSIKGRLKSMIVLDSGKKVFPEEIEQLIAERSGNFVKDALVFSHLDERGETVITAKLVLDKEALEQLEKSGDQLTIAQRLEKLFADVNAHIPGFKRVQSHFYSFQDMIRTTTLKVKRPAEIEKNMKLMKEYGIDWRKLSGLNIDEIVESVKSKFTQNRPSEQK